MRAALHNCLYKQNLAVELVALLSVVEQSCLQILPRNLLSGWGLFRYSSSVPPEKFLYNTSSQYKTPFFDIFRY